MAKLKFMFIIERTDKTIYAKYFDGGCSRFSI